MPTTEAGAKQYVEPDESELLYLSKSTGDWQAANSLDGYHIKIINHAGVVLEPLQEGVLRYPPVRVWPEEIDNSLSRQDA